MRKSDKYSEEARERAVLMVLDHQAEYASPWAAIESNQREVRLYDGDAASLGPTG